MSKATKVKHVQKEVLEDFNLPEHPQQIVRILTSRGNNLHEVETDKGEKFLASMPTKFRRNVWVKRGNFVIIDPIEEGDKVKAEIIQILYKEQIKYIKEENKWPQGFDDNKIIDKVTERGDADSEDDSDIFVNTNRARIEYEESEEDSSDEEDTSDEEEDEEDADSVE